MQQSAEAEAPLVPLDDRRKRSIAWVECTRCSKWRRLAKEAARDAEKNDTWTCDDSPDESFNSCSIPQEISDADIDLELKAREPEDDEEEELRFKVQRPNHAIWQCIPENIFTHRRRKKATELTIMICNCKKPPDGKPGCGEDCLNRTLNHECNAEWCPCGDQCSNRMFARKEYAQIIQRRAGPKGFGLYTLQDLKEGQFIIEYIGEVLDNEEYQRRKQYYTEQGNRHWYFMRLDGGETVDAARKGHLGRFINHSCEPNCRTEFWRVAGDELAIGLFADKDIPADSELTFDYNFERYGDKPIKCLCGSKKCKGYMGGKQSDKLDSDPTKLILQAEEAREVEATDSLLDSSYEDPEPIMVGVDDADDVLAAMLDAEVGLGKRNSKRLSQLAGLKGIPRVWDTDSDESEDIAETGSKGSMNQGRGEAPSRGQSDAESMQSSQHRRKLHKAADAGEAVGSLKRIANGASFSRQQEKADSLQQIRSNLLKGQGPSRKRPRPSSAQESSPSTSTAQRSHDKRLNRALSHDLGISSTPGKITRRPTQERLWPVQSDAKRSEVSRRLDLLVFNLKGKVALRKASHDSVVRFLRLFNLCDLGFTSTEEERAKSAGESAPRDGGRARIVQNAVDRSQDVEIHGSGRPPHHVDSSKAAKYKQDNLKQQIKAEDASDSPAGATAAGSSASAIAAVATAAVSGSHSQADPDKANAGGGLVDEVSKAEAGPREAVSALPNGVELTMKVVADDKDHGVIVGVSPALERLKTRDGKSSPKSLKRQPRSPKRSTDKARRREHSSPHSQHGTDTESGEVKEPDSPVPARPLRLSGRQQARLADTSLLLDVILHTDYGRAPELFVECGTLRQLHTMLTRCLASYAVKYDAVIGKMLQVVKDLPFCPDDIWHTRNAQGTFADALRQLADVRLRARDVRDKFTPSVANAALDLLKTNPSTVCKKAVDHPFKVDRLPYSPRPSRLSSPRRDKQRPSFRHTPPGREPSGKLGDRKPADKGDKATWSSGKIVDWTPPGARKEGSTGAPDSKQAELPNKATSTSDKPGTKSSTSPDGSQHRPTTVMRATYLHAAPKPPQDRGPSGTPHQAARPAHTHAGPLPSPPAFGTPLSRPQSAAGPYEVPQGTLASGRPPHRLHMARGPGSPPSQAPPPAGVPLPKDPPIPVAPTPLLHQLPPPPGGLPPPPMPNAFLPPPPAALQLPPPMLSGLTTHNRPAPPKGPPPGQSTTAPGQGTTPSLPHTIGDGGKGHLGSSASLLVHALSAPAVANASDVSHDSQVQPPLPTDPPDSPLSGGIHDGGLPGIASPASGFSSPNPPPLPFSPPPVSPALPGPIGPALPSPNDPPLPPPPVSEARGRKRSRWDAELSPDQAAASQENAALDDGEIPPAEANESVEASSRTATTNGHLGQQWGGLGSPALVIGSRPRPPFSSNSTVIGHPAGMGNSLPHKLPSASSSQLQAVTEDDFPTGWHEIDASFESYVGFAVTKNLAKFPKEARKAVGGDNKILRRCREKVVQHESKNLREAQEFDKGASIQKAKVKAQVGLLVKGYCTQRS